MKPIVPAIVVTPAMLQAAERVLAANRGRLSTGDWMDRREVVRLMLEAALEAKESKR
jgi:hypothetical protein